MDKKIFGPKIGKFVIGFLVFGVALVILLILQADTKDQRTVIIIGSLVILVYGTGMVWWLGWPIRYLIDAERLEIQTGKTKEIIDLDNIVAATSCLNFSLANTWSFHRIRIEYISSGSPKIQFIAPDDRSKFLEALSGASSDLIRNGDNVVRKKSTGKTPLQ